MWNLLLRKLSSRRHLIILSTNSSGLLIDAQILKSALRRACQTLNLHYEIETAIVDDFVNQSGTFGDHRVNKALDEADIIVFLQNVIVCRWLYDTAKTKILVPNPEWMRTDNRDVLNHVDVFWHKSRFSYRKLREIAPAAGHCYIGFTSVDPMVFVKAYHGFAHFKGKSPKRHSKEILDVWKANPHYPILKYHFYYYTADPFTEIFEFDEWLSWNNISVRFGRLDESIYFHELSKAGIHLCTSASEGFGHYINEARAMAAVPVIIDAPPMNELVDKSCGIVIPAAFEKSRCYGIEYAITKADIESCIDNILTKDVEELSALGQNARRRYLAEKELFLQRIHDAFHEIVNA